MDGSNKPHTHGEGIDILVKSIQKKNCLNNHIVNSVDIEFHLCSAVTVPQTQLSFF